MPPKFTLTPREEEVLNQLYTHDGAWTETELACYVQRPAELLEAGLLVQVYTVMGTMTLLGCYGRKVVFETTEDAESLHSQLDRAYLRHCLTEKGYTLTTQATTRHLKNYSGRMKLLEVVTERGAALVGGSMTTGGISRNGMDNIAVRLKSSALAYGFQVILFTPHPRLGQERAKKYQHFLTLETRVPGRPKEEWSRLKFTEFDDIKSQRTGRGPFLNNYLAMALEDKPHPSIPAQTVDLLLLDKAERREQFLADLQVDRAISHNQLKRHYGLDTYDLGRVPYVESVLRPVYMRKGLEIKTHFYLARKSAQYLSDHDLMHFAGTGEMRRQLGVEAGERWVVNQRNTHQADQPDAVYRSAYGDVAVEFDVGSYTLATVRKKLDSFADGPYLETVWGVTSDKRRLRLEDEVGDRFKRGVLLTEWWKDLPPVWQAPTS